MKEVCEALEYAHNKKTAAGQPDLIHRDVSPQNILVSYDGEVKLTTLHRKRLERPIKHRRVSSW